MIGQDFVQRVNARCEAFLSTRRAEIVAISEHGAPMVDALEALTTGGKKLRPILAWIGWRAAGGDGEDPAVEHLGVALELFQAAALVHDDVIDRSATRRGQPSTHRRFEALHTQQRFSGNSVHFGTSGAILAGDLALAWASEAFDAAEHHAPAALPVSRSMFRRMHTEVITGQYLDVVAEVGAAADTEAEALRRARAVLTFKAAKYSTEYPVMLGCALAGVGGPLLNALSECTLPLGQAFQLRDDLLGIFGDSGVTGKPVGDDLREGKRTELIAYGLFRSNGAGAHRLESMLGRDDLTEQDVSEAREILVSSGASAAVESDIDALVLQSTSVLEQLRTEGVDPQVLKDFDDVRRRLVSRTS